MKKTIWAFAAFAVIALGGIFIFGQRGEAGRGGRGGHFGERGLLRMAERLNLSDEQKTQIKTILADSKTRVKPLMEEMRAQHETLEALGTDGQFDAERVEAAANAQTAASKQLIVEKEKTKAAVFAVLTPEQRTQAAALKNEFKGRMKDRFRKRFSEMNGPEE